MAWASTPLAMSPGNSNRQIVGGSSSPDGRDLHAFLFTNGCMHDLNDLVELSDLVLITALAINDEGVIMATGRTHSGAQHAVALLPADSL
jgi:probable HAF family extracellular repeat protein